MKPRNPPFEFGPEVVGDVQEQERYAGHQHHGRAQDPRRPAVDVDIGDDERAGGEGDRHHARIDADDAAAVRTFRELHDPCLAQGVEGAGDDSEGKAQDEPGDEAREHLEADEQERDAGDCGIGEPLGAETLDGARNERPGDDDAERRHGGIEPDDPGGNAALLEQDGEERKGQSERDVAHRDRGDRSEEIAPMSGRRIVGCPQHGGGSSRLCHWCLGPADRRREGRENRLDIAARL